MATAMAIHPLCAFCNEPITDNIIKAMGQTFHENHLLCSQCNNPIKDRVFNMHNNKPYCKEDYEKLFAKTCAACGQLIKDFVLTANNNFYHKNCFVCTSCQTPLSEGFFEKKNKPYCKDCAVSLFSHRCKECKQPIEGTVLNVMGGKYHPECFRCSLCGEPITGNTFRVSNDQFICTECSNKESHRKSSKDSKTESIEKATTEDIAKSTRLSTTEDTAKSTRLSTTKSTTESTKEATTEDTAKATTLSTTGSSTKSTSEDANNLE